MTRERMRQFAIGSQVRCSDGVCGQLRRVVIEPVDRALTHLVVKPAGQDRAARLIPVELVGSPVRGTAGQVVLRCSLAEFENFEHAHEMHLLASAGRQWGYEKDQMLTWPHYRLGPESGGGQVEGAHVPEARTGMERADLDEFRVRRGDRIHALDGPLGRVRGLVVNRVGHQVTHVLVDEGHPWGRWPAAVPIGAVIDSKDGVRLNLTREQVLDLPSLELGLEE